MSVTIARVQAQARLKLRDGVDSDETARTAVEVLKQHGPLNEVIGYGYRAFVASDGSPCVTLTGESVQPQVARRTLQQELDRLSQVCEGLDDVQIALI